MTSDLQHARQQTRATGVHLYVFCLDDRPVPSSEIDAFVWDGAYFEPAAHIATVSSKTASDGADWQEKSICYQQRKRPVVLTCERRSCALATEVEEAIDALQGSGFGPIQDALRAHLRAVRQLFVLEIDPAGASDACWEMVDNLQSQIARQRKGLIYVPGEGCYDAELQPILDL